MTYIYTISYDDIEDEFYAWVFESSVNTITDPLFTIESTEEIAFFIKDGIMKHIDDVDGLKKYLIELHLLKNTDELLLSEKLVW